MGVFVFARTSQALENTARLYTRAMQTMWNPARTWVFAVGVIAYPDGEHWPQEGRRDAALMEVLAQRGVPRAQMAFLTDANATRAIVMAKLVALLQRAAPGDTLLFYYTGHGDKDAQGVGHFALYDEAMSMPSLFTTIERHFRGSHALLFADCCYSGSLALDAIHRSGRVAYGVLTSSSASLLSTGEWTFTNCVLKAFDGGLAVDEDRDGLVSFRELGRYAEREMAFGDGQLSTFATTPAFDADLILAKGVKRTHPRIGDHVNACASDGEHYRARILGWRPGEFEVRFLDFEPEDDEWLAESAVSAWVPDEFPPGTRVDVEDEEGEWHPAEVLAVRSGVHLVHYDDYEDIWDEWVDTSRMRAA